MTERTWTILDVLKWSEEFFGKHEIDAPRLDAEVLLGHVLETQRILLYTQFDRPLTKDELAAFKACVVRRARDREPVAYIVGTRGFWTHDFQVNSSVLIPRPETEHLVELAVNWLKERQTRSSRVVDIGTGSGAIAVSIASEVVEANVLATDISQGALEVARDNVAHCGLVDRIELAQGDLFAAVPERFRPVDLIVSNPPYVSRSVADELAPELRHEPQQALFAERDGLAVIDRLVRNAPALLVDGGALMIEIGFDQGDAARELLGSVGFAEVVIHPDLSGLDRVAVGVWGTSPG